MASRKKDPGTQSNMDVDYVLTYRFADQDKPKAVENFEELIQALGSVGFATEVRNGNKDSILIFAKLANDQHLLGEVYRSRVKDWLHGVRSSAPDAKSQTNLNDEPLKTGERLRILYQLITNPRREGGLGVRPGKGKWKNVESIFPLHDYEFNRNWIKKWASQYVLKIEDLDEIRDQFGEKIAFYFAFTQAYFTALIGIAVFGVTAWTLLGNFSPIYGVVNGLLCVGFLEYWKHQEEDLAIRWNVKSVSTIETKRHDFHPEKEIKDPVTGEPTQFFPAPKRFRRQLLVIPFALAAATILGALIATCFAIEIFVSEVYKGPGQSVLVFLPTGILSTVQPLLLGYLTQTAEKLTLFENYSTDGAQIQAMIHKIFVLNFITSYLPIFLTAFVYVPFASILVPYLDVFGLTLKPVAENVNDATKANMQEGFDINPDRLKKQVIYFTVTAQVVNQLLEVVVPYLKRRGFNKFQDYKTKHSKESTSGENSQSTYSDPDEEKDFLNRIRKEAYELETYDVTTDFREMIIQYGYLSLFSLVWPLTPISFLVNNWIELRTDAVKICVESKRPVPWRAESIGPWIDALGFLTWLGSLTSAAVGYMFAHGNGPRGTPDSIIPWALLLAMMGSEHFYFFVKFVIQIFIGKLDSPGRQKERKERFDVRRKYLEESLGEEADRFTGSGGTSQSNQPSTTTGMKIQQSSEPITRKSLEEEARMNTLRDAKIETRFWNRQRSPQEVCAVGREIIEQSSSKEGKKGQ